MCFCLRSDINTTSLTSMGHVCQLSSVRDIPVPYSHKNSLLNPWKATRNDYTSGHIGTKLTAEISQKGIAREGGERKRVKENKGMDRVKRKREWRRQQVNDAVGLFPKLKHWINHHFIRSSSNSSFRHQRLPSFSTTSHPQSSGQWTAQIWAKRSWEIVIKSLEGLGMH